VSTDSRRSLAPRSSAISCCSCQPSRAMCGHRGEEEKIWTCPRDPHEAVRHALHAPRVRTVAAVCEGSRHERRGAARAQGDQRCDRCDRRGMSVVTAKRPEHADRIVDPAPRQPKKQTGKHWTAAYRDPAKAIAQRKAYRSANRARLREATRVRRQERTRKDPTFAASRREDTRLRSERRRAQIAIIKNVPCVDCGRLLAPECMDFDHRDDSAKIANISRMSSVSFDKVLAEIQKCDLVCANCHRLRTRRQSAERRLRQQQMAASSSDRKEIFKLEEPVLVPKPKRPRAERPWRYENEDQRIAARRANGRRWYARDQNGANKLAKTRERRKTDPAFAAMLRASVRGTRLRTRDKIWELKRSPCVDCAECFAPECMDFDHRDPSTKHASLAQMFGARLNRVLAEIRKCDLVCANCHRTRTRKRRQGATRKPANA